MDDVMNEFCIEWIKGEKKASVTAPNASRIKGKVLKLAESHPDEVDYIINKDGSIFAHVPVDWVKISPPTKMNLTEEEKQKRAERMRKVRESILSIE